MCGAKAPKVQDQDATKRPPLRVLLSRSQMDDLLINPDASNSSNVYGRQTTGVRGGVMPTAGASTTGGLGGFSGGNSTAPGLRIV